MNQMFRYYLLNLMSRLILMSLMFHYFHVFQKSQMFHYYLLNQMCQMNQMFRLRQRMMWQLISFHY
jgi:hypothetical protein